MAALLVVAAPARAGAQDQVDPADTARFRFGPLRFTPAIALTDIGFDDNVFNESTDPKRDTTAAFGPAVNAWMRLGRGRVTAKSKGQYLFFKTYDNQRGWNSTNDVLFELPLARIRPFAAGGYVNARERSGFEIDTRARRRDKLARLGTEWRLSGKTSLVLNAEALWTEFGDNEQFLGASLANNLNRVSRTERLQFRQMLTPLTTFIVNTDTIQDRFTYSQVRNADSVRVMSGFELKPFALISGTAFVGMRHFNVLDDNLPDYNGLVASVDAKYALRATQFAVRVGRDISYSFEPQQPYYTLTDAGLSVTQRITRVWEVVGRVSRQTLAYRNLETSLLRSGRVDHALLYGGGIGYRLGTTLRLGVDVNNYRRTAPSAEFREYSGLRVAASVTYGFAP